PGLFWQLNLRRFPFPVNSSAAMRVPVADAGASTAGPYALIVGARAAITGAQVPTAGTQGTMVGPWGTITRTEGIIASTRASATGTWVPIAGAQARMTKNQAPKIERSDFQLIKYKLVDYE